MSGKLKIIPLGGLNEIGKNMTVYEYGEDIIVVDCGIAFPDDDMLGIDLVIPDVTYLVKNRDRIRAFILTHGHEDHIGALPYVLRDVKAPLYTTRLTAGLIEIKLEEHGLLESTEIHTLEAGQSFKAGCFNIEFVHVNHSIADSVALAITTPMGVIVHTGDFKIDPTPIDGSIIDLGRLGTLGKKGVLALLCDSTNVERQGYSTSERKVGDSFDNLFKGCDSRIIVTTFASNVHRIQQVLNISHKYGRKVGITGRSMENAVRVATELGYMQIPPDTMVEMPMLKKMPKDKVTIITTGSQGETMSALYRMAFTGHKQVEIGPGDRVIISASAIPGNEVGVSRVINELYRKGAEVIYDKLADLHVSGHACQEELKIMHALVNPKFFIPVHGEQRHLRVHAKLAQNMGQDPSTIVIAENGRVIEMTRKSCKLAGTVQAGNVLVDGYGVGDVGSVVLRDRRHLAQDGMIVVVAGVSADGGLISGPDIITRGFVYVKESEMLMEELRQVALDAINESMTSRPDRNAIKSKVKGELSAYLYKKTKRSPMILPVIMDL